MNRTGALAAPPPELVSILDDFRRFHAQTGGAFDPTVQPLWRLYATHFAAGGEPTGPSAATLAEARARVGLDAVRASRARIAFTRPGMALTLNGIAQGWITDRIVDLMRAAGVTSSLVDMGEIRALATLAAAAGTSQSLAPTPSFPSSTRPLPPLPPTVSTSTRRVASATSSIHGPERPPTATPA